MNMAGAPLSLRYHSDQLNNKVISLLKEFYVTGEFCDIIIHVGSLQIHAHRVVLAAFSPYFRDLFHQPSSQDCKEITLRSHLKEEAVRQLVDFCYSSDITVDSQSADKILTAANFLQIKEVEKLCITFLAAQQALKPEGGVHQSPPAFVSVTGTTQSPTQEKQKGDNSRELACADTSGIGSNNTSPRQSSRPSSVPSGNGSVIVQPMEDTDLEVIEVKKEQDEQCSDQSYFNTPTSRPWTRPDYDSLRSSLSTYPGFFFPPVSGALALPTSPAHHQLLMKALSQGSPGHTELRDLELYPGKFASSSSQVKAEDLTGDESNMAEMTQSHQCHICLKFFQSLTSLKTHMSEHREILTVPTASPYKMMSPVRKLSSQSSLNQSVSQVQKDEDFGGSNMCGTCGKSFRDPQSLKFHRYNHVLRYQCNYCGKRFSRSWNLHRHRKTHYRQMHETSLGGDEVAVIDVDNEKLEGASYSMDKTATAYNIEKTATGSMDKDKILTSPYADYRNHRHDMMPFAFDIMRMSGTSTYSIDEEKSEIDKEGERLEVDNSEDNEDKRFSVKDQVSDEGEEGDKEAGHITDAEREDSIP